MPLLRPVNRSNNGCCAKKGNRMWPKRRSLDHAHAMATSSLFPKGLLRVQDYHQVLKGLIKMNGHTQGGGVQVVNQDQFKVLLPSGCQGQEPKESIQVVTLDAGTTRGYQETETFVVE